MHIQMLEEGLFQGIEIVNYTSYSDEAFQLAIDHNLTILGCSDVHGLIDQLFKRVRGKAQACNARFCY